MRTIQSGAVLGADLSISVRTAVWTAHDGGTTMLHE
jgi:biotin operon repressor